MGPPLASTSPNGDVAGQWTVTLKEAPSMVTSDGWASTVPLDRTMVMTSADHPEALIVAEVPLPTALQRVKSTVPKFASGSTLQLLPVHAEGASATHSAEVRGPLLPRRIVEKVRPLVTSRMLSSVPPGTYPTSASSWSAGRITMAMRTRGAG